MAAGSRDGQGQQDFDLFSYEQLKPLEWMIGRWVDKDDKVNITTECQWTENRSFITRSFTVAVQGEITMSGMQIIGWDPAARTIRSWTFDSDGSFAGSATWTCKKDRWFIREQGVSWPMAERAQWSTSSSK